VPELVEEVRKLRDELSRWTDGRRGLLVHATNRSSDVIRSERPIHIARAKKAAADDGLLAFAGYFMHLWRRRRGWYER